MESLGKVLVGVGLMLVLIGALFWLGVGRERGGLLPGDLSVERDGFKFYFPVVTCLVISLVLSLLWWLFRR